MPIARASAGGLVQPIFSSTSRVATCDDTDLYCRDAKLKMLCIISRNDFVRNGSPRIQRSLRRLRVLTQRLPRGPRGADEPRAIAKQAGFDGNGS